MTLQRLHYKMPNARHAERSNGLGLTKQSLLTNFAKPGHNLPIKTSRTLIQDAANATDKF